VGLLGLIDSNGDVGEEGESEVGGMLTGIGIKSPSRSLLPTDLPCLAIVFNYSVVFKILEEEIDSREVTRNADNLSKKLSTHSSDKVLVMKRNRKNLRLRGKQTLLLKKMVN